jgi:hypothetical protein
MKKKMEKTKIEYIDVVSFGAGKQSTYMLLTALQGMYGVIPDFAIFSDTGCEPDYVYDHIQKITNYVKIKYNFDIIKVSEGNIMNDTLEYLSGKRKRVASLPLRLEKGGLIMRQCTYDYKIKPLRQYLQKKRNGKKNRLWIGFSFDEMNRYKPSSVQYIEHYYPLIEKKIRNSDIILWFEQNYMNIPKKSACLVCPFHSDNYWSELQRNNPEEFKKACEFDNSIRNYPKLKRKAYLSKHLKPLSDIFFSIQPNLFSD